MVPRRSPSRAKASPHRHDDETHEDPPHDRCIGRQVPAPPRRRRPRVPELPLHRGGRARVLGEGRHLPGVHRQPRRRRGVRLLRRPALRQRPAALRPPAHRVRQGRGAALRDDARQEGGAALRVGHPRAARRARGRARARDHGQVPDRGDGHRGVQQAVPRVRAQVHRRVGNVRHPPGPLGGLRERLQDARRRLHGIRHLGLQAAVRQEPRLRGLPRAPVLLEGRDAAFQPRAAHGRRRLPVAPGPRADRRAAARRRLGCRVDFAHRRAEGGARRGVAAGLDDDAMDAPVQPRRRRWSTG